MSGPQLWDFSKVSAPNKGLGTADAGGSTTKIYLGPNVGQLSGHSGGSPVVSQNDVLERHDSSCLDANGQGEKLDPNDRPETRK